MMLIKFPAKDKENMVPLLQKYFLENHDERLGNMEAALLLDFVITKIGPSIYNQAVDDCRMYLRGRLQDVEEGLDSLEKPTPR